jgi:hypothetical protein
MIVDDGQSPPQEIPVDPVDAEAAPVQTAERKLVGTETVKYLKGEIEAEHYVFETPEGAMNVWINESVAPTGIVRIASDSGDLILREYGVGGDEGTSPSIKRQPPKTNITVKPREPSDEGEKPPASAKKGAAPDAVTPETPKGDTP